MNDTGFEKHHQWVDVKEVCLTLRQAGFQALLAGGCVRDLLMHRSPNDFDIATNATPDEVEALFDRAIAVGKAFGVIVLPFDGFQVEVATFREDLEYKDGRRPEGVRFSTPEGDAARRDFTVNALFLDPQTGEVIDYVDGQADIGRKLLRTVGSPNQRFDEDKLRILRAVRFSAQLGFEIEAETLQAIEDRAADVSVVSQERIRDEIVKLLKTPARRRGLELLISTRILENVFPGFAADIITVENKWLSALDLVEKLDATTLLALFVWPAYRASLGSKATDDFKNRVLKSLRLDNSTADDVLQIMRSLETVLNPSHARKGELIYLLTKDFAAELLAVADALALADARPHQLHDRSVWNESLAAARPDGHTVVPPLVSGKELMAWGVKPGPALGQLLHEIYLQQLEGTLTSRAEIEAWIHSKPN